MIIDEKLFKEIDNNAQWLLHQASIFIEKSSPDSECRSTQPLDLSNAQEESKFLDHVKAANPKTIPALLLELEIKNSTKAASICDAIDIDTSYYSKVISGKRNISENVLYRICLYHKTSKKKACELFTAANFNLNLDTPDHRAFLYFLDKKYYDISYWIAAQEKYKDSTRKRTHKRTID